MIWSIVFIILTGAVIVSAAVAAAVVCIVILLNRRKGDYGRDETEVKTAGDRGEAEATRQIRQVLHNDDTLLTNVELTFDGMRTELDSVIVNTYGVFIIEVKNYSGVLKGGEDDFEWTKIKTTRGGKKFEKTVKNPIKQVRRQTYILAKYLERGGTRAWVTGFVLLLQGNSPVQNKQILTSLSDLDHRIHTPGRKRLSAQTAKKICTLLRRSI